MPHSDFAAIVLAGGKSTRLGRDKASEPLLGQPMLQHVLDRLDGVVGEAVLVAARGQSLPPVHFSEPLATVEDFYPDCGPLGGLYTGLTAMNADAAIAVACDMPLLRPALVRYLFSRLPGYEVVIPVSDRYAQTLCAVYSKACLPAIKRRLDARQLKLSGFFEDVRVLEVEPSAWRAFDPLGLSFLNVNRDEDLAQARAVLQGEGLS